MDKKSEKKASARSEHRSGARSGNRPHRRPGSDADSSIRNRSGRRQGSGADHSTRNRAGKSAGSGTNHNTDHNFKNINEREIVLDILTQVRTKETFSHVAIKHALDQCSEQGMPASHRAFIKRLAEGTLERQIELDAMIAAHMRRGAGSMKPVLRDILRMAVYQICYMDAVPDSAACNEAVNMARRHKLSALTGFVNGILRSIVRDKEKEQNSISPDQPTPDTPDSLSVKYSMPKWITSMWAETYGLDRTRDLLASLLEIRPVTVRFDERLTPEEQTKLRAKIIDQGVKIAPGKFFPYCCTLTGTSSIRDLPGFADGKWTVQDESSMFVAEAAGVEPGQVVCDVCSAPGGKAMHVAAKLKAAEAAIAQAAAEAQGEVAAQAAAKAQETSTAHAAAEAQEAKLSRPAAPGRVYAYDLTPSKTRQIRANVKRMHLDNIQVGERDARIPDESMAEKADIVLCDVPCSGLGVIGKKRDIKYHVTPEKINQLTELQKEIVCASISILKPGGTFIYSTCTINRAENEEMAQWINKELGLIPDSLEPLLPAGVIPKDSEHNHYLQLLPSVHETDGFFLARFKKPAAQE